jgi:hypothetical protein
MTAQVLPQGKQQFFKADGTPAVGWKIYTTDTGTNNPRTTWLDSAQVTPNPNPIVLDARGEAVIFFSGSYRVRLEDNLGNTIWSVDGISYVDPSTSLIADLATFNNGSKGAGMIGFGPAVAYIANTVGSFLKAAFGRTTAETTAGVTPTAYNVLPNSFKRFGAVGDDTTDDTAAVTNGMAIASPMTAVNLDGGRYKTTAFSNALGMQFYGPGFVEASNVVKTAWGRRYPLSFGSELLWAFQSRVKAGNTYRATFTGDSTTAGTNVSAGYKVDELFLKCAQRMGGIGCTTVNRGQSGKSTADWISTYVAGDLAPQPHLLVVRWGINDGYTAGANLTPAQSIANIRTGLAACRAAYGLKDMAIILCTPNSTSDSAQGRDERFYEQIIHGYRQAALDYQCAFLDLYSLCQDSRGGSYATLNSAAQTYMDDPSANGSAIHPGDTMATVIASALADLAFRGLEMIYGGVSIDRGTFYTKLGADLPSTYPVGLSIFRSGITGATPFIRDGFVHTINSCDDGQLQTNWGYSSALLRSVRTRFGRAGVWDAWDNEWIAPALTASWVNSGGALDVAGYTRDMYARVYLKGSIKNGTVVAGDIIMTLPAGYRPSGDCTFAVPCSAAIGQIKIIAASGQVQVLSGVNNTYLSLEGINFMAAN